MLPTSLCCSIYQFNQSSIYQFNQRIRNKQHSYPAFIISQYQYSYIMNKNAYLYRYTPLQQSCQRTHSSHNLKRKHKYTAELAPIAVKRACTRFTQAPFFTDPPLTSLLKRWYKDGRLKRPWRPHRYTAEMHDFPRHLGCHFDPCMRHTMTKCRRC